MASERAARPQPSIPALVFILWSLVVPLVFQRRILNADGDLPRHLRHGDYMLRHGGLIHADPFSFTRPGQPFVGFEYGSQVLLALAYRLGGLPGVAVLTGLLIGLTYALAARLLLRRGVDPLLAYLTVMAASILGAVHWVARPHLVSLLFVVLLLYLLERQGRLERPWLAVPLFAVWSNLHGGFVYGLVLIGIYLAGSLAEMLSRERRTEWRGRARYYASLLGLALLGSVLNAHGPGLYLHIVRHLGDSFVMDNTAEFMSPDFHQDVGRAFLLALLLVVAGLALSRRRPSYPALFVILANTAFSLVSLRNIPLFGLTALIVLALHLDPEWRLLPDVGGVRGIFSRDAAKGKTLPWVAPVVAALIALGAAGGAVGPYQVIRRDFDSEVFPVEAVRRARTAGLSGRLFSEFIWGGYLLHAWPEEKVFIDGGTDFYGGDIMRDWMQIRGLLPGWRDRMRAWDIDLVLVASSSALADEMVREPGWGLWYCDKTAALFRRQASGDASPDTGAGARLHRCSPPSLPART